MGCNGYMFPSFGNIYTELSIRLDNVKATKFVFCYRPLRDVDELHY